MSEIRVDSISSKNGGAVNFGAGMNGDGNNLKFNPKIIQYSPEALTVGVGVSSNIVITFDQNIQFSNPSGTIEVRSNSATGTVEESFITGSSSQVTISGNTLTIDPSSNLSGSTKHYVILPSVGIANTYGKLFSGLNEYNFTTETTTFSATGGSSFTRSDSNSPTGTYKYHVFTSTGGLIIDSPVGSAIDFKLLMVGGGGGGASHPSSNHSGGGGGAGGLIVRDSIILDKGEYTVTIGGGGNGTTPTVNPFAQRGNDTRLHTPTGTDILLAKGGGGGWNAAPGVYSPESNGGSGGGVGYLGPAATTETGGKGYIGQGTNGAGYGSNGQQPYGYQGAGGGGGAVTEGMTYTMHTAPPSPTGLGVRSGPGGSGRAVPEFRGPYIPPTSGIPGPALTKIGPQGLYGGGGGGGASAWPGTPSHPYTAGAGGPGGGGHGAYVDPSYSPFSPSIPTNASAAESGYQGTGGGGGGNRGPYPSYPGANGGSGIFMVRYSI